MRMRVDQPRRETCPSASIVSRRLLADFSNRRDLVASISDIGPEARHAASIDDQCLLRIIRSYMATPFAGSRQRASGAPLFRVGR